MKPNFDIKKAIDLSREFPEWLQTQIGFLDPEDFESEKDFLINAMEVFLEGEGR